MRTIQITEMAYPYNDLLLKIGCSTSSRSVTGTFVLENYPRCRFLTRIGCSTSGRSVTGMFRS